MAENKERVSYGTAIEQLVEIMVKLKDNGIALDGIIRKTKIEDLLKVSGKSEEEQERILKELGVDKDWPIGTRIDKQKREKYRMKFKESMERVGIFSEEEVERFTTVKVKEARHQLVRVLRVLSANGIDITAISQKTTVGDLLEGAEISEEEQKEILTGLQIDNTWPIGVKLSIQKEEQYIERFAVALENYDEISDSDRAFLTTKREVTREPIQELIDVLKILKARGISIMNIPCRGTLGDVVYSLKNKKERNNVIEATGKAETWPIWVRISVQRRKANKERFREALVNSGEFSEEEIATLTHVKKIHGQDIGKASYDVSAEECDKASRVMLELMLDKVHSGK